MHRGREGGKTQSKCEQVEKGGREDWRRELLHSVEGGGAEEVKEGTQERQGHDDGHETVTIVMVRWRGFLFRRSPCVERVLPLVHDEFPQLSTIHGRPSCNCLVAPLHFAAKRDENSQMLGSNEQRKAREEETERKRKDGTWRTKRRLTCPSQPHQSLTFGSTAFEVGLDLPHRTHFYSRPTFCHFLSSAAR